MGMMTGRWLYERLLEDEEDEWLKMAFKRVNDRLENDLLDAMYFGTTYRTRTDLSGTDEDVIVLTKGRDYREEDDGRCRSIDYRDGSKKCTTNG